MLCSPKNDLISRSAFKSSLLRVDLTVHAVNICGRQRHMLKQTGAGEMIVAARVIRFHAALITPENMHLCPSRSDGCSGGSASSSYNRRGLLPPLSTSEQHPRCSTARRTTALSSCAAARLRLSVIRKRTHPLLHGITPPCAE